MLQKKSFLYVSVILLLLVQTLAFAGEQVVKVQVEGLSCPFCAFGLEKKLRQLEGARTVTLKMDQGEAVITFVPDTPIDKEKIKQAVVEGGFTPGKITISKAE